MNHVLTAATGWFQPTSVRYCCLVCPVSVTVVIEPFGPLNPGDILSPQVGDVWCRTLDGESAESCLNRVSRCSIVPRCGADEESKLIASVLLT